MSTLETGGPPGYCSSLLAVDLLVGVLAGVAINLLVHLLSGVPVTGLFKAHVQVERVADGGSTLRVRHAGIFSNYLSLKKHLDGLPRGQHVVLDLSEARMVDHSTLLHLHDYAADYHQAGRTLELAGLDAHITISAHPLATRYFPRGADDRARRPTEVRP